MRHAQLHIYNYFQPVTQRKARAILAKVLRVHTQRASCMGLGLLKKLNCLKVC